MTTIMADMAEVSRTQGRNPTPMPMAADQQDTV